MSGAVECQTTFTIKRTEVQLLNLDSTKRKYDFGWCPKMSETDAIAFACGWYQKGTVGEDPAEMIERQIK